MLILITSLPTLWMGLGVCLIGFQHPWSCFIMVTHVELSSILQDTVTTRKEMEAALMGLTYLIRTFLLSCMNRKSLLVFSVLQVLAFIMFLAFIADYFPVYYLYVPNTDITSKQINLTPFIGINLGSFQRKYNAFIFYNFFSHSLFPHRVRLPRRFFGESHLCDIQHTDTSVLKRNNVFHNIIVFVGWA